MNLSYLSFYGKENFYTNIFKYEYQSNLQSRWGKKMKKIWMFQLVVGLVFVLVACSQTYSVTFVGENGEVIKRQTYREEEEITPPDLSEKTGHRFDGWFTSSGEDWDDLKNNLKGDVTLYAQWLKNAYELVFVDYDGTIIDRMHYEYGASLEGLEEGESPSRIGYTFEGWDQDLPETMPASNLSLQDTYQINEYVLSFLDKDGQVIKEASYEYGADLSNVVYPSDPSKARYVFTGWDTVLPETMPNRDLSLTAMYVFEEIFAKVDSRALYLDNKTLDGKDAYYGHIYRLVASIEEHALYPSLSYEQGLDLLLDYYRDGISKEDYVLEDENALRYANYASKIATLIRDVPYVTNGFKEGEAFSYLDTWITTYANEDYLSYYSENDEQDYVFFEVLVEEDNIRMNYIYESDTEILYQRNDFEEGYINVHIRNHGNEEYSYTYEQYDYQTNQYKSVEYKTYKNTFQAVLGDYQNKEVLTYRKDVDSTKVEVKLLMDGYRDMVVEKTNGIDELYKISYHVMNVSGWDYFSANQLYLDEEEVLSAYHPKVSNFFAGIRVEQSLETLTESNYQSIGNATYQGTITLLDIQNALANADSIADDYNIFYTENKEVDYVRIDSVDISLEDLKDYFEDKIGH